MRLNQISTLALNDALRSHTLEKQVALRTAQVEVATGRKEDIGLSLGVFSSSVVSINSQIKMIDQMKVTNSLLGNRLSAMQTSMSSIIDSANGFVGQLTAELEADVNPALLKTIGNGALGHITSSMNVTFKGEFIFSGVNTDAAALVDYNGADGAAAKTAVQTAFQATFGFLPGDPAAENITPAAFEAFVDGPFGDLFNDTNWQTLWTGASDRGMRTKISARELVETPTTADASAFRQVVAASVLISEFSEAGLNPSTTDKMVEIGIAKMMDAIAATGAEQSKLGVVENRIANADERMELQKNIYSNQMADITEVDAYEAALRLNEIANSLESSYAATARIQGLSLLNFL